MDAQTLNDAATETAVSPTVDRLLLHLTIIAGYGFLGFFGWLLTL